MPPVVGGDPAHRLVVDAAEREVHPAQRFPDRVTQRMRLASVAGTTGFMAASGVGSDRLE